MKSLDDSLQITSPPSDFSWSERVGLGMIGVGIVALLVALGGAGPYAPLGLFLSSFGLLTAGSLVYFTRYRRKPAGIQNDGAVLSSLTARGAAGWVAGVALTAFYVVLYWFPGLLTNVIPLVDPLSQVLRGRPADQWFLYGFLYTLAVGLMGVRAIWKYRQSRYQTVRTISVIFFQLGFAFLLPSLLAKMNEPEFYFSYFWPLDWASSWFRGAQFSRS
jgi:hypothetical protein